MMVMGGNGELFWNFIPCRRSPSHDGLPKLRRLQVVCIVLGGSLQIIPAHSISWFPVPRQLANKEGLAGLQNLLRPSGSAGGCYERLGELREVTSFVS